MKKLFLAIAAVATLLASCSKEDGLTGVSKSQVTFTVSSPEMATRYGEGEKATTLYYAVYDAVEGGLVEGLSQLAGEDFTGGEKQVTINLVEGRTYSIIFYAQNAAETPYYVNWQSQVLYIPEPAKLLSNKETYDAFYAHEDNLKIGNAAINKTITLRRPFAQLNILTSQNDIDLAKKAGIEVKNTAVTVKKIYTQMNLMNDAVVKESETAVTFGLNTPAEGTYTIDGTDYKWLAMNYLLVNEQKMVDVEFTMEDTTVAAGQDNMLLRKYGSIHVERNHRTNIYGALITNPAIFNVKIDEEFFKPDYDYFEADVWDGESATSLTPALDENGDEIYVNAEGVVVPQGTSDAYKLYEIEDAADAAGFRNQVMGIANGTTSEGVQKQLTRGEEAPNTFANAYIKLMTDIDLNWEEWVPIGNSTNKFQGIFDGNGHTIRNLQVSGNNSYVGLFGFTTNGKIKNLTVENAKVSGYLGVGVVAGSPYTSTFTNIKVTGHVEVNGFAYVGGVGGRNAYANWTNVTVDVDNTSYVKANSVEGDTAYRTYVGGVVGFNGEGGHTFENITSNIDVEGSTMDVGGMFGIAHYGNNFVNCSSSGDVKITNAADAEEIGGIAGVWHNQDGTQVTFTNCSFTGNLSVNVKGVDLSDNTIVGKPYSPSGKGSLWVNGTYAYVGTEANAKKAISEEYTTIKLFAGEYLIDLYNIAERETLNIIGTEDTKVKFDNLQVRASQFKNFTIKNCEILRMPNKSWGHLVFGSGNKADGVYTVDNCIFNGQDSQGIFINEITSGATYNITNCTFDGNFGDEGAVTIQNNDGIEHTVNVKGCTFKNIPDTSHKIYIHYAYNGWTLNTDAAEEDIYWKANN